MHRSLSITYITGFCGHFTYIETLWKLSKEAWNDPKEMFCSIHTFFLWPYMVSWGTLQWKFSDIWRRSIWKYSITAHSLYLVMSIYKTLKRDNSSKIIYGSDIWPPCLLHMWEYLTEWMVDALVNKGAALVNSLQYS